MSAAFFDNITNDMLDCITVQSTCGICGDEIGTVFTESHLYTKDTDTLIDTLDTYLNIEQLEQLEQFTPVIINAAHKCSNKVICKRRYLQRTTHVFNVPLDFEDTPLAESSSILNDTYGVLFTGTVGVGKTYQAVSLLKRWVLDNGGPVKRDYRFINVCELLFTITENFNKPLTSRTNILRQCMSVDILVLDDLGTEKFSEWSTSQLYLLINHRMDNRRPTIITTNIDVSYLAKKFNERIASRLSTYVHIEIQGSDRRISE